MVSDTSGILKNVISGLARGVAPEGPPTGGGAPGGGGPAGSESPAVNEKDTVRRVAIGSDHGGFDAKEKIKTYLKALGYHVTDVGTSGKDAVDYPDFALKVAKKVASGECDRGIMVDGAGIGSCMACNKVKGIRAAMCYNLKTIVNSREHNNANLLTLGGPLHSDEELYEMTKAWLETRFAGGRHWPRVNKIMAIERG